jgi:tetratricopeptide (TPR) repeat protein
MSQRKLKKKRKEIEQSIKKIEVTNSIGLKQLLTNNWLFLVFLLIGTVLLFLNGMKGDFVSDDYASITQNPEIGKFIFGIRNLDTMSFGTYMINLIFGQSSPVPYHIFGLILFLLFLVLSFVFIEKLLNNNYLSKITVLLLAVHPIHVETVSWISGRIYLILAVYTLLALISFLYFLETNKNKYIVFMCLFFLLAFLTDRPRPFALFLLIIITLLMIGFGEAKKKIMVISKFLIPMLVVALVTAIPFVNKRINIVNSGTNASGGIFYDPFFQYPITITKYLQLLWAPVDMTLYHTMYTLPNWLNWLTLILYITALIYFFFKNRKYFFALSFIFLAILPSMTPIKVAWLVAERYMLLGSIGFCLLLGLILVDIYKRFKPVAIVLAIILLIGYGVRTIARNADWRTNHSLWVNTCQVSPNSHNAWNNIGDDYDKLKDYASAIKGFTQSTLVKPNYADAYHNRANIFYKVGRFDLARESYDSALKFNPDLFQTYLSLTQIDLTERKLDLALAHASRAVEMDKNNPQTLYVLAVVYAEMNNTVEAEKILQYVITNFPSYTPARNALTQLKIQQT